MVTFFSPSGEVTVTGSEGSTSFAPSLTDTFIGCGACDSSASTVSLIDARSIVHAVSVPDATAAAMTNTAPQRRGAINNDTCNL
ncbi:hypothetical protein GCM10027595_03380 [Corynebacterium nasicanis]